MNNNRFYKIIFLISFIVMYIGFCVLLGLYVYHTEAINNKIDVVINSIYELDYKGEIELNTQAINYLRDINKIY